MQQVCSNFLADPSDTSFGFQIKCKNCQFTRKQHIQNNQTKPNQQDVIENKTITSNSKEQVKLVNAVGNAFQNPKMQESMKGSQNQQKPVKTIQQNVFVKATSINENQNEKDETDQFIDHQTQFERQNVKIYNSDKTQINQTPNDQEKQNTHVPEEENGKGLSSNPSSQQDKNLPQNVEQLQNNKNEPEEVKPKKLQTNPFIKQDQNTNQKVEQSSNKDIINTNIPEVQQPKKLQSNPFIQKNKEQPQNQTAFQGNQVEEQKIKKLQQNQFMKMDQNPPQKVEQKGNQGITIKPQVQVQVVNDQKDLQQTENQQKQHQIQNQYQIKLQNNLKIPEDNSNSNQQSTPQSVKEKAKSMQIFGFGAPPPNRPPQDPYIEKPQEQFLLDRPIVHSKKHIRSPQDFQDIKS